MGKRVCRAQTDVHVVLSRYARGMCICVYVCMYMCVRERERERRIRWRKEEGGKVVRERLDEINERITVDVEFCMSFECKLYHQHLGYGADAEDIHGDADLHGRTCNQQNHPALVALIIRQSLINRVRPIRVQ